MASIRSALRLVAGTGTVVSDRPLRTQLTSPQLGAALPAPYPTPQIASPFSAQPSSLSTIVWADILDQAGLPMTRTEAMSVPAIAKARHVVAPKVAGLPLRAFRFTRDENAEDDMGTDSPIPTPGWVYRTDDGVSPWHRMVWTADDLIFTGWSLWLATRGYGGAVLACRRVDRDAWWFDADGRILVNGAPIPSDRAILIPGPHEGILTFGRTAIRHARQLLAAAAYAAALPIPQLEIHQTAGDPLTRDQIDELVADWAKARRGENGGVGYTNASVELKEHGSVDGHLLVDGRNAAAVDCARLVGVTAAMIDATAPKASLNYETTQGRGLEHTEYGVEPYAEAIAARLSLDDVMPRGQRIRFDITQDVGPIEPTGPTVED